MFYFGKKDITFREQFTRHRNLLLLLYALSFAVGYFFPTIVGEEGRVDMAYIFLGVFFLASVLPSKWIPITGTRLVCVLAAILPFGGGQLLALEPNSPMSSFNIVGVIAFFVFVFVGHRQVLQEVRSKGMNVDIPIAK